MERQIFKVNVIAMLLSFATTLIFAVFLRNLNATVLSIVLLLATRSILAELILAKRMQIEVVKDIWVELLMTLVFIASNWFLSVYLAAVAYGFVYLIYSIFINYCSNQKNRIRLSYPALAFHFLFFTYFCLTKYGLHQHHIKHRSPSYAEQCTLLPFM